MNELFISNNIKLNKNTRFSLPFKVLVRMVSFQIQLMLRFNIFINSSCQDLMLSKFTLVDLSMSMLSSECPKLGKMRIEIRNKQKTTGSYRQTYLGN